MARFHRAFPAATQPPCDEQQVVRRSQPSVNHLRRCVASPGELTTVYCLLTTRAFCLLASPTGSVAFPPHVSLRETDCGALTLLRGPRFSASVAFTPSKLSHSPSIVLEGLIQLCHRVSISSRVILLVHLRVPHIMIAGSRWAQLRAAQEARRTAY